MEFKIMINKYMELIKKELPNYYYLKNKGCALEEVEKYEKLMELEFPKELKELYMIMNGDNKEVFGFIFGLNFYTVKEMYNDWLSWRKFDDDAELNNPHYYTSIIESKIKCRYSNKKWLPIAHDCCSNYFGIDLDPDEKGIKGQIINFGRDENDKKVFADSLKDFIQLCIDRFDELIVEDLDDYRYFITTKENVHSIDYLKTKS